MAKLLFLQKAKNVKNSDYFTQRSKENFFFSFEKIKMKCVGSPWG